MAEEIGIKRLYEVFDAVTEAREYCARNANTANIIANLEAKIYAN